MSKNGSPYLLKASDAFRCRITSTAGKMEIPHVVEPASLLDQSEVKVSFSAKVSGQYKISLKVNLQSVGKGEVVRNYLPGE